MLIDHPGALAWLTSLKENLLTERKQLQTELQTVERELREVESELSRLTARRKRKDNWARRAAEELSL